jgi:hypothetical protein
VLRVDDVDGRWRLAPLLVELRDCRFERIGRIGAMRNGDKAARAASPQASRSEIVRIDGRDRPIKMQAGPRWTLGGDFPGMCARDCPAIRQADAARSVREWRLLQRRGRRRGIARRVARRRADSR